MKFLKKILEKAVSVLKNKALETVKGPVKEITDFVGDPSGYMIGKLIEKMKALGSVATSMVIGPVQDVAERLKLEKIKRLIKKIRDTIEIAIESLKAVWNLIVFVASNFLYIVCAVAIIWFIFSIFTAFSNLFSFSYGFDKTKYYDMDLFTAVKNKELMEENLYEKTSETSYYQRFVDAGIDGFSEAMFPEYLQSDNAQFLSSKLKQELAQAQYTGFYTMDSRLTVHDANFGLLSDYIQANTVDTDIEASSVAQGYLRDYFSKESNFALSDQFLMELNNKAFASNGENGEDLKIVYPEMFVKPLAFTYDFNRMQLATDSKEPGTHWEEYTYVTQRVTNDEVGKNLGDIVVNPQELIWANYYGYGVDASTTIGLADEGKIYSFASPIVWEYVVVDKDDYNIIDVKEDGTYSVENVQNKYDSEFLVLFNDETETYEVAKFYYKISGRKSLLGAIESFNTTDGIDGTVGKWMRNVGTEEEPEWKDYKDSKYYSFTGPYISLNDGSTNSNDCFVGTALVASESTEEGLAGNGLKYFHYAIPTGYRLPEDINYNADGTLMARTINTIDVREDYNLDPQKHLQLAALSGSNDEIVVSSQELYNYKYYKVKSVKEEYRNSQEYIDGWAKFLLTDTNADFFNSMADRNILQALGNRIAGLMNGIAGFFGADTGDMETSMSEEEQNAIHLMASYPQEVLDLSIYLFEKKLVTGEGNLDQDEDGVNDTISENVWDYNYSLDAYFTTDNSELDSNEFYQKFYYLAEELEIIAASKDGSGRVTSWDENSNLFKSLENYFKEQSDYNVSIGGSSFNYNLKTKDVLTSLYNQLVVDGEANITNNFINDVVLFGGWGLLFGTNEAIEKQLFMNYLSNQMTTKYTSTGVTKEHGDVIGGSKRVGEYSFISNLGTNDTLKEEVLNYSYANRGSFDQPSDTTMTFKMKSWSDTIRDGWDNFIGWFTGSNPVDSSVTYTVSIDGEEHTHVQTDYYIGTMTEYSSGVYREHIKRLEDDSVDSVPMDTTTDLPFELKSVRDYGLGSILNYVDSVVVNYKSGVFYDERYLGDEISKEILNNYKDAYRLGNADLTDPYDFKGFGADSGIKNAHDAGLLENSEGKGTGGAGLTSNSAQGLYNMIWGGYYPKEYRDFGTDRLIELFAQNNKKRFLTLLAENVDNKITELGDAYDKYNSTRVPISILGIKDGSKIKETGPDADYMDIENIELSLLNSSTKTYIDKIPEIYIPTNASKDESYELKDMLVAFPSLKDDNYNGRSMGQILGGFEIGFLTEDITKMAENDIFVFGDEFGYYTPYLDFSGWGDDKDISRVSQLLFPKRYYRSWLAKSEAEEDDDSLTVFKKLLKWVLKKNEYFNITVNMPEKYQALSAKDHGLTFAANFAEIYSSFAEGNESYIQDKTSPWMRLDESGKNTLWPSTGKIYDKSIKQSVSDGIFDTDSSHTYKGNNTYVFYLNNEMNYNIKNFKGNYGDYALISDSGLKKVYLIDEVVTFTGRFMYTYKDKLVALSTNDETDITKNIIGSYATDRYIFLDSWDIKLMADKVVDISFMFFRSDLMVRVDKNHPWILMPDGSKSETKDITIKEFMHEYNFNVHGTNILGTLFDRLKNWLKDLLNNEDTLWRDTTTSSWAKDGEQWDGKIDSIFALAIPPDYINDATINEALKSMFVDNQVEYLGSNFYKSEVDGKAHTKGKLYGNIQVDNEKYSTTVSENGDVLGAVLNECMKYTEYICTSFLMSNGDSKGYSVTPIGENGGSYVWDIIQQNKTFSVQDKKLLTNATQFNEVQNYTDLSLDEVNLIGLQYLNWWRKLIVEHGGDVIGYKYGSEGKWKTTEVQTATETLSSGSSTSVSVSSSTMTTIVTEASGTPITLGQFLNADGPLFGYSAILDWNALVQPCIYTNANSSNMGELWQDWNVPTSNSSSRIDRATKGYVTAFNKLQEFLNTDKGANGTYLNYDDIHEDFDTSMIINKEQLKNFLKSLLTVEGNGYYDFSTIQIDYTGEPIGYLTSVFDDYFDSFLTYIDEINNGDYVDEAGNLVEPIKVNEFINYLSREIIRLMDSHIIMGLWCNAYASDSVRTVFIAPFDDIAFWGTSHGVTLENWFGGYGYPNLGPCEHDSYASLYGYNIYEKPELDNVDFDDYCGSCGYALFNVSPGMTDWGPSGANIFQSLFSDKVNSNYNQQGFYGATGLTNNPMWVFANPSEDGSFYDLLNFKDDYFGSPEDTAELIIESSFLNTNSDKNWFEECWDAVKGWFAKAWETITNAVSSFLDKMIDKVVITSCYEIKCLMIEDDSWFGGIDWEGLWDASVSASEDDGLSSIFNQYVKVLNIQKVDNWQEEIIYRFSTYASRGYALLNNEDKHLGVCTISAVAFTYTIKVSDEMALDIDNGRYYSQVSNLGRLDKATNSTEINDNTIEINAPSDENENAFIINYHGAYVEETGVDAGHLSGELFNIRAKDIITPEFLSIYNEEARKLNSSALNYTLEEWEKAWAPELKIFDSIDQMNYDKESMKEYLYGTYLNAENKDVLEEVKNYDESQNNYVTLFETVGTGTNAYKRLRTDLSAPLKTKYINFNKVYNTSNWEDTKFFGLIGTENFNTKFIDYLFSANLTETIAGNGTNNAIYNENENTLLKGYSLVYEASDGADTETKIYKQQRFQALWPFANNGTEDRAFTNIDKNFQSNINEGPKEVMTLESALANVSEEDKSFDTTAFLNALNRVYGEELYQLTKDSLVNTASGDDSSFDLDDYKDLFGITGFVMVPRIADRRDEPTTYPLYRYFVGARKQIAPEQIETYFEGQTYDSWISRMQIDGASSNEDIDFYNRESTRISKYIYDYLTNFEAFIPYNIISDSDLEIRGTAGYGDLMTNRTYETNYTTRFTQYFINEASKGYWSNYLEMYGLEPIDLAQLLQGIAEVNLENAGEEALNILRSTAISNANGPTTSRVIVNNGTVDDSSTNIPVYSEKNIQILQDAVINTALYGYNNFEVTLDIQGGGTAKFLLPIAGICGIDDFFEEGIEEEDLVEENFTNSLADYVFVGNFDDSFKGATTDASAATWYTSGVSTKAKDVLDAYKGNLRAADKEGFVIMLGSGDAMSSLSDTSAERQMISLIASYNPRAKIYVVLYPGFAEKSDVSNSTILGYQSKMYSYNKKLSSYLSNCGYDNISVLDFSSYFIAGNKAPSDSLVNNNGTIVQSELAKLVQKAIFGSNYGVSQDYDNGMIKSLETLAPNTKSINNYAKDLIISKDAKDSRLNVSNSITYISVRLYKYVKSSGDFMKGLYKFYYGTDYVNSLSVVTADTAANMIYRPEHGLFYMPTNEDCKEAYLIATGGSMSNNTITNPDGTTKVERVQNTPPPDAFTAKENDLSERGISWDRAFSVDRLKKVFSFIKNADARKNLATNATKGTLSQVLYSLEGQLPAIAVDNPFAKDEIIELKLEKGQEKGFTYLAGNTYVYEGIQQSMPNDVVEDWTEVFVDTSLKTHTNAIKNDGSLGLGLKGGELVAASQTDEYGMLYIEEDGVRYYLVALGSAFMTENANHSLGGKFVITTDEGNSWYAIQADVKADRHTSTDNTFTAICYAADAGMSYSRNDDTTTSRMLYAQSQGKANPTGLNTWEGEVSACICEFEVNAMVYNGVPEHFSGRIISIVPVEMADGTASGTFGASGNKRNYAEEIWEEDYMKYQNTGLMDFSNHMKEIDIEDLLNTTYIYRNNNEEPEDKYQFTVLDLFEDRQEAKIEELNFNGSLGHSLVLNAMTYLGSHYSQGIGSGEGWWRYIAPNGMIYDRISYAENLDGGGGVSTSLGTYHYKNPKNLASYISAKNVQDKLDIDSTTAPDLEPNPANPLTTEGLKYAFDCSSFVSQMYIAMGYNVPGGNCSNMIGTNSANLYKAAGTWTFEDLKIGDVFINNQHTMIYIGDYFINLDGLFKEENLRVKFGKDVWYTGKEVLAHANGDIASKIDDGTKAIIHSGGYQGKGGHSCVNINAYDMDYLQTYNVYRFIFDDYDTRDYSAKSYAPGGIHSGLLAPSIFTSTTLENNPYLVNYIRNTHLDGLGMSIEDYISAGYFTQRDVNRADAKIASVSYVSLDDEGNIDDFNNPEDDIE